MEAPIGATRLYIIDAGALSLSGSTLPFITVWNQTAGTYLKLEEGTISMQWQNRSMRAVRTRAYRPTCSAPKH